MLYPFSLSLYFPTLESQQQLSLATAIPTQSLLSFFECIAFWLAYVVYGYPFRTFDSSTLPSPWPDDLIPSVAVSGSKILYGDRYQGFFVIVLFSIFLNIVQIFFDVELLFSALQSIGVEKLTVQGSNLLVILEQFVVSLFNLVFL